MFGRREKRYKFFLQGCEDANAGVGVFMAKEWIEKVVSMIRVNERLMVLIRNSLLISSLHMPPKPTERIMRKKTSGSSC